MVGNSMRSRWLGPWLYFRRYYYGEIPILGWRPLRLEFWETKMTDTEFLSWLRDRLIYVYGESPNVDFVFEVGRV